MRIVHVGFHCRPEYCKLTQNSENPETIPPIIPCLLHAKWRLIGIDRYPAEAARAQSKCTVKRGVGVHHLMPLMSFTAEKLQIPSSEGKWRTTACSGSVSPAHTPTVSAQETAGDSTDCHLPEFVFKIQVLFSRSSAGHNYRQSFLKFWFCYVSKCCRPKWIFWTLEVQKWIWLPLSLNMQYYQYCSFLFLFLRRPPLRLWVFLPINAQKRWILAWSDLHLFCVYH